MKLKKRSIIQIAVTVMVVAVCIIYYLYINDYIHFKILSIGDLNPYGGWSALRSAFTDVSYRWRGISRSIALTAAISIIALSMGRFFCGFICPLGALQDFFKYLGTRIGIKEIKLSRGKFIKPEIIKYIVLIAVLAISILGFGNKVSQYSPWLAYLNLFMGISVNTGFVILILIVMSSLFIKRVFCRCFCLLGAFQSLLTAIGPSKISSSGKCNGCTYCLKECPVDIEKVNDMEVSPECIRCMECTENCLQDTDGYSLQFAGLKLHRRGYVSIAFAMLIVIYTLIPHIDSNVTNQAIAEISNLKDGIYNGTGTGFGGSIQVEVEVEDNKISGITVISHGETTGYYEEVLKTIPKEIVETQKLNVDAVSGATTTSRGFINAIKRAVVQAMED